MRTLHSIDSVASCTPCDHATIELVLLLRVMSNKTDFVFYFFFLGAAVLFSMHCTVVLNRLKLKMQIAIAIEFNDFR